MTPEEINSFSRDYSRVSDTNEILWIKFEYANYEFYSWRIFLIVWCNPKKIMNNFMQKRALWIEIKIRCSFNSGCKVCFELFVTNNQKQWGKRTEYSTNQNVKYRQEPNTSTKAIHVKVDLCAYCFSTLKFTLLPIDGCELELKLYFSSFRFIFSSIFFSVQFLSLCITQNRIVYLICCGALIILTISI